MPTLCAATAPDANPAGFCGPSRVFEVRGPVKETRQAGFASNHAAAEHYLFQCERTELMSDLSADGQRLVDNEFSELENLRV